MNFVDISLNYKKSLNYLLCEYNINYDNYNLLDRVFTGEINIAQYIFKIKKNNFDYKMFIEIHKKLLDKFDLNIFYNCENKYVVGDIDLITMNHLYHNGLFSQFNKKRFLSCELGITTRNNKLYKYVYKTTGILLYKEVI